MQTEDGNSTGIDAFSWDAGDSAGVIVNMSVWVDVPHLAGFVFGEMHRQILRRRREWFEPMSEAITALWWVPAGRRPTTEHAELRVRHLRVYGATAYSFTVREHFPPPERAGDHKPVPGTNVVVESP